MFQSKADEQNLIDVLQKKVKKLESELEKQCGETEKKGLREDKVCDIYIMALEDLISQGQGCSPLPISSKTYQPNLIRKKAVSWLQLLMFLMLFVTALVT